MSVERLARPPTVGTSPPHATLVKYTFAKSRAHPMLAAPNKDLARSNNKGEPGEERGGQRYFEAPVRPGSRPHRVSESGGDEQMFGAKQQVPHGVSGD